MWSVGGAILTAFGFSAFGDIRKTICRYWQGLCRYVFLNHMHSAYYAGNPDGGSLCGGASLLRAVLRRWTECWQGCPRGVVVCTPQTVWWIEHCLIMFHTGRSAIIMVHAWKVL